MQHGAADAGFHRGIRVVEDLNGLLLGVLLAGLVGDPDGYITVLPQVELVGVVVRHIAGHILPCITINTDFHLGIPTLVLVHDGDLQKLLGLPGPISCMAELDGILRSDLHFLRCIRGGARFLCGCPANDRHRRDKQTQADKEHQHKPCSNALRHVRFIHGILPPFHQRSRMRQYFSDCRPWFQYDLHRTRGGDQPALRA